MQNTSCLASIEGNPVPLLGVDLTGEAFGAHARLVLRQRYKNAESRPIEAIYTFPIPSDASLVGFAMECAGRRLEAEVKEREEAFRAYDEAIASGHGGALLDEERRNVFTASVGNLLPGEETVIEVVYVQELRADEGALRLMIPTLVAPRYIPGARKGDRTASGVADPTDRVPDADRITPAIGQVRYGLSIDIGFDLGKPVTIESPSHAVVAVTEGGKQRVHFVAKEVALDRDLVIMAGGAPGLSAGVVASKKRGEEGTFALTVVPDLFEAKKSVGRSEVVFVIDVSGSMQGESIEQARSALRLCLRHLAEGDRFGIIAFSTSIRRFSDKLVPFTQRTLEEADAWVHALVADGGTEMLEPLLASLEGRVAGQDRVVFLLTDGQVGNESEISTAVVSRSEAARFYTFGIGTNVSDLLLNDLARLTRGAAQFIHPGERIEEKVTGQFARAIASRVEDVSVAFTGIEAGELAPIRPQTAGKTAFSDLVDGEPWVLYGRYAEAGMGRAQIRGTLRGERFLLEVPMDLPAEAERDGLAALWAGARVRDLEAAEASLSGRRAESNRQRIVTLALSHKIASKYTSFVVIETRTGDRRAQGQPEARPVVVNAPAGWGRMQQEQSMTRTGTLVGGGPAGFARGAFTGYGGAPAPAPMRAYAVAPAAPPAMRASAPRAMANLGAPPPPPPMSAPRGKMISLSESPPAPDAKPLPGLRLFESQLASGLWEGDGGGDEARLLATAKALAAAAAAGIDSAHPIYGAQVKKAIDAIVDVATAQPSKVEIVRALVAALEAAQVVAASPRLRQRVLATADAAKKRLQDLASSC